MWIVTSSFSALIQTFAKYLACFFQEEEVEHYTQQLEDLEQQVQILEALKVLKFWLVIELLRVFCI